MLELISVKKAYKTKAGVTVALNGINLKFADKGLVFITGKSGCGRSFGTRYIACFSGSDGTLQTGVVDRKTIE